MSTVKSISLMLFLSASFQLSAQNVGIGTSAPEKQLTLKTVGSDNSEIQLETLDTAGISVILPADKPFIQGIQRNGRFDQGLIFNEGKTEFHTGHGRQFINGPYIPYPSLTMDDIGRVGVRMLTDEPTQAFQVRGKIKIDDDSFADEEGVIKWDGHRFMGYDGNGWRSFIDLNDADDDSKVFLHEGATDSVIFQANSSFTQMSFDGTRLGFNNSRRNVFMGENAGALFAGTGNTAIGGDAGMQLTSTGTENTLLGLSSGNVITSGKRNTMIGAGAGRLNALGSDNTIVGYEAGSANTGSGNVFIGYDAGSNETGSNKLYIANSDTSDPLIRGDFSTGEVNIFNDLTVNDDLLVDDEMTARQVIVNDLNPQVKFNSGGATEFDITYDDGADRLTISEAGQGAVLHIKNGEVYLPKYASGTDKIFALEGNGKLVPKSNYKSRFTFADWIGKAFFSNATNTFYYEAVEFEDNSIVSEIKAIIEDGNNSSFAQAFLVRFEKLTGIEENVMGVSSSITNTGSVYQQVSSTSVFVTNGNVIDNDKYLYYLFINDLNSGANTNVIEVELIVD